MPKKIMEAIPLPDQVIKLGTLAGALVAIAGAWLYFGGPKPVMENAAVFTTIEENIELVADDIEEVEEEISDTEEVLDNHREEFLSRAVRDDKRELYTIINQMEEQGADPVLMQQQIIIEEQIQEMETEREVLRKKKKGD
jgi:hypothetical protein